MPPGWAWRRSTLFNQLTGSHAHIGNWPGLTVDLMQADVDLQGTPAQLVDLPGIYDLRGHSDDEAMLLLNMADDAKRFGVSIDSATLAEELAMPWPWM